MDNFKSPAYPQQTWEEIGLHGGGSAVAHSTHSKQSGFTKIERASLIIAQGLVSKYNLKDPGDQLIIAQISVELATEVLKEANK